MIQPFYAVKCNNLQPILNTLAKGGAGFDCASSDEFYRAKGSPIIYANPCKSTGELIKAYDEGIKHVTFDTPSELAKIMKYIPDAVPLLRIHVDDKGGSRIPLNSKFGLSLADASKFTKNHPIRGIAFHVGSDCTSVDSYLSAFQSVQFFLKAFETNPNFSPDILDIGGGFSGKSGNDVFFRTKVAPIIREQIKHTPFKRVIAEPGRFFAEESCSLHVPIIGRKTMKNGKDALTLDDSVYGMFSGVLFDGFKPEFKCLTRPPSNMRQFTIFGRTCDSADCIAQDVLLPADCNDGDIVEVRDIGAYSYVSATEFNGFPRPDIQVLL